MSIRRLIAALVAAGVLAAGAGASPAAAATSTALPAVQSTALNFTYQSGGITALPAVQKSFQWG